MQQCKGINKEYVLSYWSNKGKREGGGNNINIVVSPKQAKLTSDSFLKRFITGQGHIVFVMVSKTKS